jgi:hypothetical protein
LALTANLWSDQFDSRHLVTCHHLLHFCSWLNF